MLNVCPSCGDHEFDKSIRTEESSEGEAVARCPTCETDFLFPYRPLFSLTGAPGTGKSTVVRCLRGQVPVVVLESDILVDLQHETDMEWAIYCGLWLRVCMTLHYAGRQTLLAGSGIGLPENVADRPETQYFPNIQRCALVCDDAVLADRLEDRGWLEDRPKKREEFLQTNRWFWNHGLDHNIELVDTTDASAEQTADSVKTWIGEVGNTE